MIKEIFLNVSEVCIVDKPIIIKTILGFDGFDDSLLFCCSAEQEATLSPTVQIPTCLRKFLLFSIVLSPIN